MEETNEILAKHGIAVAVYTNASDGCKPYIECLCGNGWRANSWMEAGQGLDDHIKEVTL